MKAGFYPFLRSPSIAAFASSAARLIPWQAGAISRDTLLHNFRQGEILPPGRTNEQEVEKIQRDGGLPEQRVLQKVAEMAKK